MSDVAIWLDANGRYIAAAVAWVRELLSRHARVPSPQPPPELPRQAERRGFWQRRRLALPSAHSEGFVLIGGVADEQQHRGREAMMAIAAGMSPPPALVVLSQRLGLSEFERDVLLLCTAMELDTSIASLCARAQGDPALTYPTFALALALLPAPAWEALSSERPLRHWRLIEITQPATTPLTTSALRADERIVNYLKGITYLDDRLTPLVAPLPDPGSDPPASQQNSAAAIVSEITAFGTGRSPPLVQLLGSDPISKQIVAGLVCRTLACSAYRLDWDLLPTAPGELESFARLWQREALLMPVALFIDVDAAEAVQLAAVERLLARLDGLTFMATRALWSGGGTPIAAVIGKPTPEEQRARWAAALRPDAGDAPRELAGQFNLNVATIDELARRELTVAEPATLADRLWDACRALTRPRLDALARRLEPRAGWDDIVLLAADLALLRQIADQVGQRDRVYHDWGFAQRMTRGLGISVLFAGPPGSGKTMAAEVLANHLRLDLFRIDLSAVVSKYIGETEANLRRLFDAAEEGAGILLFDEADALFGKRTEVKDSHDRYANIEVNYLLQRMESYGGLAILATNMKSALDQAFMRRLRFVVDFPFPGPAERKAMWQKVFPPQTPTLSLDYDRLARLNLTGGHIAVIAVNAAFQAAQGGPASAVTMPMILNAARIEFRKLGRPVNEADFRWQPAEATTGATA
jgi:hypothetical protein